MRSTAIGIATLTVALALTGCGGASKAHTDARRQTTTTISTSSDAAEALESAVRKAIEENNSLSVRSLWSNRLPAHPTATAGPALSVLRQSIAQRRRSGVRVKTLSGHLSVLSIELAPSYMTATATILDVEKVLPSYRNGRPRGKPVSAREHARLELHRVGHSDRFIVWKVTVQ